MATLTTLDQVISVIPAFEVISAQSVVSAVEPTEAAVLPERATSVPRIIIGIVGSPGAGKTTLGMELVARLGETAQLLSMDGFHLPQARLVELGRRERMGAPDTFDVDGFVALLALIRFSGDSVAAPGFDRVIEEPTPGTVRISPEKRIIVVEGNYLLLDTGGWERVSPMLDVSLFVHIDRNIRLVRLIARHERFGKTTTDARAWALGPDEVNARLIEHTAARANHILRF